MWTFKSPLHRGLCYITPNRLMDQVSFSIRFACVYSDIHNTPEHSTYNLYTATPPPPVKNLERGRLYTGYWLEVIRYSVIPLQVPLLFVFTQHFHFENTLRLQTALPRTFVHEHCSSTFTQTLHWRMTWRLFLKFYWLQEPTMLRYSHSEGEFINMVQLVLFLFTIAIGTLSEK